MAEERRPRVNQAPGPGGPKGMRGPRPKLKNPGKIFKRIMGYVLKDYWMQCILVVICILVTVFAIDTEVRFSQFPKAHAPISVIPSGITRVFNPLNPQKALPITVRVSGITRSVNSFPLTYKCFA